MQVLEKYLRDAVLAAGDAALAISRKGARRWLKVDGTPVTEADIEADRILREALARAPLAAGWQSEESSPQVPDESTFWLADPIDGTAEFARGGEGWCVAVALIEKGKPVLAAIYAPREQRLYLATSGKGAMLNDQPMRTSQQQTIIDASLLGNASLARKFPEARVQSLHALALRLAAIAEGRHDGMLAFGPKQDWDIAAGDLLVREAGGKASDLSGASLTYGQKGQTRSGVVAAAPSLHASLIARTREP